MSYERTPAGYPIDWLVNNCSCDHCVNAHLYDDTLSPMEQFLKGRMFAICPTCGNKRCPKGTDHNLECTGSNEPGQEGSQYE